MSLIKKAFLLMAAVVFGAVTASPANNAEEIVFSDTGATLTLSQNQNGSSTAFGFWIWCAGAAAPESNGGYQNGNACQGQMYFYGLQTRASHVVGFATEGAAGIYTMHVFEGTAAQFFSGTLNPSFTCTLSNTTANLANGPNNTVQVNCKFIRLGGGTGSDTDNGAVVNITGPN